MLTLEDIINNSKDGKEIKRALAVKMVSKQFETKDICDLLEVSNAFVSKWKRLYEHNGAKALVSGYKGSEGFLSADMKKAIISHLKAKEYVSIEELRDYLEDQYGVLYKSKQSYYDLLSEAGLSWHKSQKSNPAKNEEKVLLKREEIRKKLMEHEEEIKSGEVCVFVEDECHLLWGDALGYLWGRRNQAMEVPILNERERQTYYGALDLYRKEFFIKGFDRANGENTVSFIKYLQSLKEGRKIILLWDLASYHRFGAMKEFLQEVNNGLEEKDWRITCITFEPNAPEQNPVEDIWLKGKNFLRKHFYKNKTFHQVKESFFTFLNQQVFPFNKLAWYYPNLQIN